MNRSQKRGRERQSDREASLVQFESEKIGKESVSVKDLVKPVQIWKYIRKFAYCWAGKLF